MRGGYIRSTSKFIGRLLLFKYYYSTYIIQILFNWFAPNYQKNLSLPAMQMITPYMMLECF